jgi:multimeric flavodoxin WrbA
MYMKCLAIQSSPNLNGLTSSLAQAVLNGVKTEGGVTELIHLNKFNVKPCIACENGWGICREKNLCVQEDDFEAIRKQITDADTVVFATPVYWHDLSESAKRFLDRLRRCESFTFKTFSGKKIIGITSAGGSGRGAVRALYNLEEYLRRLGFEIFDLVSVTRFSKDHKLSMLEEAGRRLVRE